MSTEDPKTRQTPEECILAWRAEIATELAAAQNEIQPLQAAWDAAAAEAQEASDFYRGVQRLFGTAITSLESPLQKRAGVHLQELNQVKGRKARALADLEAVNLRIKDLRRAIAQIDRVIPPAEETEEAAA